ncbi:thiamine-phosphate kinase [Corynebacterium ulcerans]|uniref:Thiamine-monophosphate kinase n=1 Tax=Corynebacterium ulcerans TaxID=65058 RepID=A0ABD0BFV2_CORUL|nr:thiamine-phosphate kinase [Corynebacterium ulcerans]BAM27290.1 thiamine monophosphate kinase [Corynebacterium ulcerans 0102]BBJ71945.1 thiamine-monophosphate kinase [Corynebacterium ulcerans]BBJ74250.1 thiamine-monophosphate kinase [Corynebacterium ulcerans]GJJ34485.1 thiamine-monophosphate kinase [Corynebacterium ulcerans]GJJ35438.1 thiamine-monophosphate kinase [Corynebacterium ulcerans]
MKEHLNPTLAEVGERAAINVIIAHAPSSRNGDDAAVLGHASANSRAVVTTDMLVQDRHFRLDWSRPAEIGRKAITQNFADIEAMGARPVAALLAISAPAYTRLNFVSELARGISSRVKDYSAELVGGDITDGEAIVIAVTAVGQLGGSLPELSLDRARPGHTIIASGGIGESAAGYALLQRFGRTDIPEKFLPLVTAHCATIVPEGRGFVARSAGVSSLTDNSDGLIVDLRTMAKKSGVSMDLDPEAIAPTPLMLEAAELLDADPWHWVLGGGEDHTLMGTTAGAPPTGFRAIGIVGKRLFHVGHDHGQVLVGGKSPAYDDGWVSF